MKARKAMFAGSWYPGNASECEREIKDVVSTAIHGGATAVNAKAHGEAACAPIPCSALLCKASIFLIEEWI
jgi:predicted class III extradiol MEMO1 family dioxygenase